MDIIDKHDIFQNQWNKRRIYYKKCNYSIKTISNTEYSGMDLKNDKKWKTVFEPKSKPEIKDDEDEPENTFNNPNKISSCLFEPIID